MFQATNQVQFNYQRVNHQFSAIFNSKLFNYQRVYSIKWIIIPLNPIKSQLNLIKSH
jgi:hypothetical protein